MIYSKLLPRLCVLLVFFVVFAGCTYHPRTNLKVQNPVAIYDTPQKVPQDFILKQQPKLITEIAMQPFSGKKLIVIDPGHGGEDFGTKSLTKPKYHEKSLNLTTAILLNEFLSKMGYVTIMTRTKDEFISLQRRADIANEKKADLFISVHYNSAPSKEAEGIEVFYFKSEENKLRTVESRKLASQVLSKIIRSTDAKSRGVKQANFAVIRETKMPAILIEGGFLTNASELEKVKDPSYIKTLAWGIAQGVHAYMNTQKEVLQNNF